MWTREVWFKGQVPAGVHEAVQGVEGHRQLPLGMWQASASRVPSAAELLPSPLPTA